MISLNIGLLQAHEQIMVSTASTQVITIGIGTCHLRVLGDDDKMTTVVVENVYHIPTLSARLLSLGEFLKDDMLVVGDKSEITILRQNGNVFMTFLPRRHGDSIFIVPAGNATSESSNTGCNAAPESDKSESVPLAALAPWVAKGISIDYETLHRRFGHPSNFALRKLCDAVTNSPDVEIPATDLTTPCKGCAQGKMPAASHPVRYE